MHIKILKKIMFSTLHPFFFTLFPILFLYSHNINQVFFSEILLSTGMVLVSASILILLLHIALRNFRKAGVIASSFLIPFFLYGHFATIGDTDAIHLNLYPMYELGAVFLIVVYIVVRTKSNLLNITIVLNTVSLFLVLVNLSTIVAYQIRNIANHPRQVVNISDSGIITFSDPETLPDIYYIIFDRYANAISLKEFYNFDNSEFLQSLENKGFYVAYESRANYLKTAHSLASSLNLGYINYMVEHFGENSNNWRPLYKMLKDYEVWRFLKKRGYKFIHFGSWWKATDTNPNADFNFNLGSSWTKKWNQNDGKNNVDLRIAIEDHLPLDDLLIEYPSELYKTTLLYPIAMALTDGKYPGSKDDRKTGSKALLTNRRVAIRERILRKFERLAEIPKMKAPTFVFAHMLIPHPPYVFNSDGSFPSEEEVKKRGVDESYIQQVIFVNTKIQELVDELLLRSKIPPIIIIQGDEGPFPYRYEKNKKKFNWNHATKKELRKKLLILNTYYLPNVDNSILYPTITPVNTFRVIFNLYFNTNYELLSDRSYVHEDERHLYKFTKVNDKIFD